MVCSPLAYSFLTIIKTYGSSGQSLPFLLHDMKRITTSCRIFRQKPINKTSPPSFPTPFQPGCPGCDLGPASISGPNGIFHIALGAIQNN
jgi:hypothetical protein